MTDPDAPPSPSTEPRGPDDAEAARLLQVGLTSGSGRPPRAAPAPAEMGAHFPELELIEVLGQGGMGVVYKARQKKLDRLVALKVLPRELSEDPAFAERFAREARTLARLQHPHIVGVHEFGDRDGLFFLVMEYVDGVNLRQLMAGGELTPREALAIVPQICDALQYAHDEGVVHRDIKPENILLDRAGRVRVADFGLAKLARRGAQDFTLTGSDQVMGTVHYMAPEQYKTPQEVDHRADIFSLGVVFYEMLTGELPVGRFKKPSEAKDLDERIDEIVMRALEREREMRYQKAADVESDVKTVVTSEGKAATEEHRLLSGARARHAQRHGEDERPLSRFVPWGWGLIFAGAVVPVVLYFIVFEMAARARAFHAGTVALWTGIGFACAALLVNAIGAVMTRRRVCPGVRGHGALVAGAILAAVASSPLISGLNQTIRKHQRESREAETPPRSVERAGELGPDWLGVAVSGASDPDEHERILSSLRDTWTTYLERVSTSDLTPEDVGFLYITEEHHLILEMDTPEFEKLQAENALGMGFVGQGAIAYAPHEFRPDKIEIDEWHRSGTATFVHLAGGKRVLLRFPVRNDAGQWKFAIGPVTVGE